MLRKPTYFALLVTIFFVALYAEARHDLVGNCPDFFKKPPRAYATPAGADDIDDGSSFEGCTNADPAYIDMQKWLVYVESGGTITGLLLIVDVIAYNLRPRSRGNGRRGERPVSAGVKLLLKISNFFGGF
jgi:hypothetical protein